jgi:hypothetical protein
MKHWAVYLGTINSHMKFVIETLPITNKQVYLPVDECDELSEKELAERLTTAIQWVLPNDEITIL